MELSSFRKESSSSLGGRQVEATQPMAGPQGLGILTHMVQLELGSLGSCQTSSSQREAGWDHLSSLCMLGAAFYRDPSLGLSLLLGSDRATSCTEGQNDLVGFGRAGVKDSGYRRCPRKRAVQGSCCPGGASGPMRKLRVSSSCWGWISARSFRGLSQLLSVCGQSCLLRHRIQGRAER